MPAPPPPESDPFIEAAVERAVAPYKTLLPADALQRMRDMLRAALAAHPTGMRLVAAARPRPMLLESDDLVRGPDGIYRPVEVGAKTKKGGS